MNNNETFIKLHSNLLRSVKLTSTEKIFISYIISYQSNNLDCFESNTSISKNIGISIHTLRKMITKFNNEFSTFFITEHPTNETHIISIDIEKLNEFLGTNSNSIKKEKTTQIKNDNQKVGQDILSTEIEAEMAAKMDMEKEFVQIIEDEINPSIEINEEEDDEVLTYSDNEYMLWNKTVVKIPNKYLEFWNTKVVNQPGTMKTLNKENNQWVFDIMLETIYEQSTRTYTL